jgi:hypothetical protein
MNQSIEKVVKEFFKLYTLLIVSIITYVCSCIILNE